MNIDYLHSTIHRWKGLIDNFEEAEKQLYVNPVLSIISSRRAMEWLVKDIYKSNCDYYDINLTVFEMINEQTFIDCIKNKDFLDSLHYVRKVGNSVTHGSVATFAEAAKVLKELHYLIGETAILYGEVSTYPSFVLPSRTLSQPENTHLNDEIVNRGGRFILQYYFQKGTEIKLIDGSKITILEKLGEGGQGIVYKVKYNSKEYALKWYLKSYLKNMGQKNPKNVRDFYENLISNASNGAPSDAFLWPIAVTEQFDDSFGYLMDLYPSGYVGFSKFLNASAHFSNTNAVINATINMVQAFQALHQKGYSYQDINDGNFFVNPQTGAVLICDNDNVAPYGEGFGIGGKSRYMAPEIVLGEEKPNTHSDDFSLSVVLFMFYFLSHPLEGQKVVSCACLTDKYERRFYAEEPIFICDPNNTENRPVRGIHNNAIKLWPLFPGYLQEAFIRAFSRGAKNKNERLTENEWLKVFYRLKDDLFICAQCGEELFASMEQNGKIVCNDCGITIDKPLVLEGKRTEVALYPTRKITSRQIDGEKQETVIGTIVQNKNNPNLWGLRNMTTMPWIVTLPNGEEKTVSANGVVPIVKDIKVNTGNSNFRIK